MKKIFAFILMLTLVLGVSVSAAEPALDADAAVIVNAVTGERYYELNPTLEHAMASTTKVMVALLSLELVENYDGPQELRSRTLPAIESDLPQSGDSVMDLVLGEQLTIYDAVRGLMLPSGNDAARLLARTFGNGSYNAFVELMNEKAAELGCTQTCFTSQSGLDAAGHYTTAADYAKIVNYAMGNPRFRAVVATANYTIEAEPEYGVVKHELENSNKLLPDSLKLPDYSYAGVTGVKTGTTSNAGACIMVSAENEDASLIISLLGAPLGSPKDEGEPNRYTEATKLLDYGFEVAAAQPYTVTAEGNTLTATNPATGYVMTATISAPNVALTGASVEPAIVTTTYPEGINWCTNWEVTYTNNDKVGTAAASISFGGKTASVDFEIVEPTVTLTGNTEVDTLVVPAGQTYDLNGNVLGVHNGLVVNEGGKIVNGVLSVDSAAIVSLGDNGGWVPVLDTDWGTHSDYVLYPAEIKAGKSVISTDGGTKYSFGYKLTESGAWLYPYADAVAAGAAIKFGVELTLDGDAVDYSFSQASVDKMAGINASAASDEFFKVNLNLAGVNNDLTKVRVAPVIKVGALGFRYVGEDTGEGSGKYVARINTQGYYTLEDAVAAAAELEGVVDVKLVSDIEYKRPVTLELNGKTRFIELYRSNITISGPVTFDGKGVGTESILFRVYSRSTLTLKDGVTVQNYVNTTSASNTNNSYGAVVRVEGASVLNMDGVTVKNCVSPNRGVVYVTGNAVVDIKNSTFTGNTAKTYYGGAIGIYSGTSVNVENCTFEENTAATYGGAIGIFAENDVTPITLTNNRYINNTCGETSRGGAIGVGTTYGGKIVVDGGSFSGNSVDDIGKGGGEFVLEGAIEGLDSITLTAYEYITVGETLALDEPASVSVTGASNSVTLTGAQINAGKYITENGMRTTVPKYIATVGDKRYESFVEALKATENATAATTVELYGDETVAAATTVTLNPNVQIKVTAASVIDGPLTVEGTATAHASAVPIVVDGCKLTLKNGATLKNITSTFKETDDYHGILRIQSGGELELNKATVTGCKAPYGVLGGRNYPIITLVDATLSNNESTGSGGAIFAYGAKVAASNTVFDGNKSGGRSGAIHIGSSSSKLTMTGCTFKNNTAENAGGAICFYSKATGHTFTNCTFTDNVAGKQGGAVCIYSAAEVSFDGVTMSGNKANSATTATANGISYIAGSLALSGAIDIDWIAMNSGKIITLDAPATFAQNVTVSGPKSGAATFSGSKVSEYYKYFTHKTETLTFDSTGKCVAK